MRWEDLYDELYDADDRAEIERHEVHRNFPDLSVQQHSTLVDYGMDRFSVFTRT